MPPARPPRLPQPATWRRRDPILPAQPTALIGREADLRALQERLSQQDMRLITLTGPAGVGKTRLALAAATALAEHGAEVCFVDLAPLSEPRQILSAVTLALGLQEADSDALTEQIEDVLRARPTLLVLDNFEHVLAAAPLLADLLAACPLLTLLVTSRAALHLRWEHELPVLPLALPEPTAPLDAATALRASAVKLFVRQAQAVRGDFTLTDTDAPTVVAICARLDGLPLALELAAARVKLLPLNALLARLESRLTLLVGGAPEAPPRHRTLVAALAWSYDLLTPAEQQLFRWLGVFAGGCSLAAAEAVAVDTIPGTENATEASAAPSAAASVLDHIASLLDKSLLQRDDRAWDEPRYRLLETLREYALVQLRTNGEEAAARSRHAAYFLNLAETADAGARIEQARWQQRLDGERDNLRAALQWAVEQQQAAFGMRLVGALRWWYRAAFAAEGRRWAEAMLALPAATDPTVARAMALYTAGSLAWFVGDFAAARVRLAESVACWRGFDEPIGLAFALASLAQVQRFEPASGAVQPGLAAAEESVKLFRESGHAFGLAVALLELGSALASAGTFDGAQKAYAESLAVFQRIHDQRMTAIALLSMGTLAALEDDDQRAVALFEESLVLLRTAGDWRNVAFVLALLGQAALRQGAAASAATCFAESLPQARRVSDQFTIAVCIEGLGLVAAAAQRTAMALRLCGAAAALREARGIPRTWLVGDYEHRMLAELQANLGETAFAALWAEGYAMVASDALALALTEADRRQSLSEGKATVRALKAVHGPSPVRSSHGLSAREVEVLRQLASGRSNPEIAAVLTLSIKTVERHLATIYRKIGAQNRVHAVTYAMQHGFV